MKNPIEGIVIFKQEDFDKAMASWLERDDTIIVTEEKEDVIQFHLEKEMLKNKMLQKYYNEKGYHV